VNHNPLTGRTSGVFSVAVSTFPLGKSIHKYFSSFQTKQQNPRKSLVQTVQARYWKPSGSRQRLFLWFAGVAFIFNPNKVKPVCWTNKNHSREEHPRFSSFRISLPQSKSHKTVDTNRIAGSISTSQVHKIDQFTVVVLFFTGILFRRTTHGKEIHSSLWFCSLQTKEWKPIFKTVDTKRFGGS